MLAGFEIAAPGGLLGTKAKKKKKEESADQRSCK